jgi:hypothetical protein
VLASANGNKRAERPLKGLLDYVYALLEAETAPACLVVGLDPGLGIVDNDARGRQSLGLDLMEPIRPKVEHCVLDPLDRRTLRKVEFAETPDGHCRLKAPRTHELAGTIPQRSPGARPNRRAGGARHRSGDGGFYPIDACGGHSGEGWCRYSLAI